MRLPVYLDNHSTTQPDPRVVDSMLPFLREHFGNAASRQHEYGWVAEAAVELARREVAALIGAAAGEIVFTSGATESINLALKGVAGGAASKGRHIITAVTEHRAVLETCAALERSGFSVTHIPVDASGVVDPSAVDQAITPLTILVSLMAANNEIGTIAPMEEIGKVCRARGVLLHSDATQAVGKIPVDVSRWQVDLLSFSAHKMHGPKGVGALYVRSARPPLRIAPQIEGGGHEAGLRSGTANVPAIVGFGTAAELARQEMAEDSARMRTLRDRLVQRLVEGLDGTRLNGHPRHRLPNNANLWFPGAKADAIMMQMKDVAVSSGSACSSASPEPSHVLKALGLSKEQIHASLRFGLSRFTTEEEIDYASTRVVETVHALREQGARFVSSQQTAGTGNAVPIHQQGNHDQII